MAFFDNGNFEAIAANSNSGGKNNGQSDANPFGLKDFSKLLDNKFGNSAFSSNLLEKPKGVKNNNSSINPFDKDGKWARPDINDTFNNSTNPFSIKSKPSPKVEASGENSMPASIFQEAECKQVASIFDGIQINKGTGMAKGGAIRHKLDFCY